MPNWRAQVTASGLLLFLIVNLGTLKVTGLFFGSILGAARGGRETVEGTEVLVFSLAAILFQTLVLLVTLRALILRRYGMSWADLGLVPCSSSWALRACLLALGLLPAVAAINASVPKLLDIPFENPQILALAPAGFSWPALIGMIVMGGIMAPIAEEIAFRGLFFGWLRQRMGFGAAAIVSALAFAVLHGVLILIPALTAVGLALAWIAERSGSIWPAIVTHAVFNSFMIAILYAALAAPGQTA